MSLFYKAWIIYLRNYQNSLNQAQKDQKLLLDTARAVSK